MLMCVLEKPALCAFSTGVSFLGEERARQIKAGAHQTVGPVRRCAAREIVLIQGQHIAQRSKRKRRDHSRIMHEVSGLSHILVLALHMARNRRR